MEIPNGYYRLSVKALILDESRTKFLLVQEDNGKWELPGGGLDWGEKPQDGLVREIKEEMGLEVTYVSDQPVYITTAPRDSDGRWVVNVLFETTVRDLHFTASEECVAITFVTREEAAALDLFITVREFLAVFDPSNH
jgi:8-oxo-dGTP diphosphatase